MSFSSCSDFPLREGKCKAAFLFRQRVDPTLTLTHGTRQATPPRRQALQKVRVCRLEGIWADAKVPQAVHAPFHRRHCHHEHLWRADAGHHPALGTTRGRRHHRRCGRIALPRHPTRRFGVHRLDAVDGVGCSGCVLLHPGHPLCRHDGKDDADDEAGRLRRAGQHAHGVLRRATRGRPEQPHLGRHRHHPRHFHGHLGRVVPWADFDCGWHRGLGLLLRGVDPLDAGHHSGDDRGGHRLWSIHPETLKAHARRSGRVQRGGARRAHGDCERQKLRQRMDGASEVRQARPRDQIPRHEGRLLARGLRQLHHPVSVWGHHLGHFQRGRPHAGR